MDSINSIFAPVMDVLEKNKDKNILVHCFMGSSRSAVIVLLYLIKVKIILLIQLKGSSPKWDLNFFI